MSKKPPDQLYLADDLQPPPDPAKHPAMELRIFEWLEARDEKRRSADKCKDREHLLMADAIALGYEKYPYTDSITGKKRYFVADKTPKPKTIAAFEPKKPKPKKRDAEEIARREETEANRVEQRRVPRASVADEIGEGAGSDPFAATRKLLAEQRGETEH